ncbi:MAG: helix-turn-helix domain-containing protein [Chitinophagaceae bacterium]|nr:helix-turn-helix domain-containing protein [Chitinophagaceae bacterium]MCW5926045.1 helix-turn-helix domain-containing protein [Chitinophagaceae bacterium]
MPKTLRLSLFFLLILSVCAGHASAQTGSGYETLSATQGLSQGLINDMLQDKEGFIWIATKGGLNRYDGYSFKVFTTDPQDSSSISSNSLSNLLEDSRGRLWIGTYDGGVNVYNKRTGRFLRISQASGLSSNRVESDMTELPDGSILVSPQGGSLNVVSLPDAGEPVISSLHIPGGRSANWILKDEKGLIWIDCDDNSIFIFNPSTAGFDLLYDGHRFTSLVETTGKFISAKFSQALGPMAIPAMRSEFIDSTGQLEAHMVTNGKDGTFIIDNRFPVTTGASGCNFYDFNAIKAGDNMNDVYARNLKTNVRDQNIKCLLLDRSGVLWVGTMGHGIYKYHIRNDRFHPVLPNMSIQRITTLNNDMLYVQGWSSAKLLTPQGEERTNPVEPVISDGLAFTNVIQEKTGGYWLYWNGQKKIYRYTADKKLATVYDEAVNTTATEQLQPFIQDSRHRIWVCGANGTLARIDPATGKLSKFVVNTGQYTGTAALTQTNAFYEDRQGIFWLGTEHGFARLEFTNDTSSPGVKWFKNIPGNHNSLSYNYVSWFMDDPADNDYLWICTKGGGLNRMQKSTGKFIHYTTKQGLPNDVVYGILADNTGNIWGSTNRGIFCMLAAKEENDLPPVFRVFSTSDGLQADEFNTNALAKLSNGDLAFGGVNGLNIFSPQKVLSGSYSPNVYITAIQIANKTITPGDETGVLEETIEQTASITLSHLQDVLTLEFSSLDYTAPGQNKYRYQLAGIDKGWVESGTRRTATYLHLPAGKYTFKVQGSNSQGIWSDKIAELKIVILPPWWRTGWAYMIYALLIALAIRAYLRFNVNKAKLQSQLNYEQLEAKRVKELDTIKTQLYTNITHEFRTPLTVILGMARQVVEKPTEQFDTRMDMIVRNGQSLLNLVNQLLDLSKLETGKMKLQLSHGDVIHFLRYIVESFHSLAESQQKQLHFLTDIDGLHREFDREKLRQIVSNLLSNAIKFTPEKGNIYISVSETVQSNNTDNATLIIKVKDTGIGIPEGQLQYVFDRFYQLDNSHTRKTEGTGIGLALTKELVKLMDGEIVVKSPPSGAFKGSEFTVSLPLKKVTATEEPALPDINKQISSPVVAKPDFSELIPDKEEKNISAPLILLVEDNADVVAYTASCLSDYRLAVGKDGREGFDIATDMIPDLIITDVMMPFVDGFELVNKLRRNENTSHIPVIMLTAKADISSRIEGLQQGADAYLEKPFNKEELLVRINKLLEMRKNLQQYYLRKAGIQGDVPTPPVVIPDKTGDHTIEDGFVKKVREAVEQNLTDVNFTVEKLCRLVFMSHSQLHRKLEALTGCSPNKFIRMIRLKKARELLQNSSNSIAAVALDCGYSDPGYFSRVFRQEYGVTPQEWRSIRIRN